MITTNGNRTVAQPHCFFFFLSANNASLPMEVFVVLYRKRQFWSVPHVNWDLWILHWKIESVLHVNWDLWILDWKIHDLVVPHSMRQLAYIEKRQDWIFPQTPTKNFSLVLHGRLRDWFAIKFKCHRYISTLFFIHYFIYLILTAKSVKIGISDRQGLQDTLKMLLRSLQDAARSDLGWIWKDFGMIFEWFLVEFWCKV